MNAEQISRQFFEVVNDCEEYYNNLTSQQEMDIILDEDEMHPVDYIHPTKGVYHEAIVLKLKKNSILVRDLDTNKATHIQFTSLTVPDQLYVLALYEQNQES